ncbi:MAG: hypothetical protein WEA04_02945 [Candidatus Andersenbacteria bacterium]
MSQSQYVFFLGNHPELSGAECLGVLSSQAITWQLEVVTPAYFIISVTPELPAGFLSRLGGTERIARVVAVQEKPWQAHELRERLFPSSLPEKLTLGVSTLNIGKDYGKQLGRDLKNLMRQHNVRLRFILPQGKSPRLNSAQVLFNKLLSAPHQEITVLKHSDRYWLLQTVQIQDIAAYELRDTQRPVRDAKIGMLPPKLAQIMLNLATASLSPQPSLHILDPFCGMGTIVQEGWLQRQIMVGTDIEATMITASQKNIAWVAGHGVVSPTPLPRFQVHDVRQPFPLNWRRQFDAVVTEPYLGPPLHSPLPAIKAEYHIAPLADLYMAFFENVRPLLKPGGMVLVLLPAFRRGKRSSASFTLFPQAFLDAVGRLGYSPRQLIPEELADIFRPSPRHSLLYSRSDALVGREITLWESIGT